MPRIFISYRRADSAAIAGRIREHLVHVFGKKNVFMDVENIPPGEHFPTRLEQSVSSCDVMLVIIGPDWATITDEEGRLRLHNPNDFVHIEVKAGLSRSDIKVIPVLVEGAKLPRPAQLPPELRDLLARNAAEIRLDPDFKHDVERLIRSLRPPRRGITWILGVAVVMLIIGALIVAGVMLLSQGGNGEHDTTLPTTSLTPQTPTRTSTNTPEAVMTLESGEIIVLIHPGYPQYTEGAYGGKDSTRLFKSFRNLWGWTTKYKTTAKDTSTVWVRWDPQLEISGLYVVSVFIPSRHADTENARYKIQGVQGVSGDLEISVKQYDYSDEWVQLGVFQFDANDPNAGVVSLNDLTGEEDREIAFDAVLWQQLTEDELTQTPPAATSTETTANALASSAPIQFSARCASLLERIPSPMSIARPRFTRG